MANLNLQLVHGASKISAEDLFRFVSLLELLDVPLDSKMEVLLGGIGITASMDTADVSDREATR